MDVLLWANTRLTHLENRLLKYLMVIAGQVLLIDMIVDWAWEPALAERDMCANCLIGCGQKSNQNLRTLSISKQRLVRVMIYQGLIEV